VQYITGALKKAWDCKDWTNMVNVTIYPYGNANERQTGSEWTFSCQHGEAECDGNMVETCFINLAGFDQDKFMDFILAYEASLDRNSRDPYSTAKEVYDAGSYTVSWDDLNSCMGSSGAKGGTNGNAWEHQMALWTNAANHQYTPWITLNGKHTTTIQDSCTDSTLECTCQAYSGTNSCCSRLKDDRPKEEVCWKDAQDA